MFTGIIEEIGRVAGIVRGANSVKLSIDCEAILDDLKVGDSVAVDGICLTVTFIGANGFTVDGMPQTIRKSALGLLALKQTVNLERALKLSDRLGGHIVSGHIDGVGVIRAKEAEDNALWLTLEASPAVLQALIPQGSVALNGVSLTVASLNSRGFRVSLIPLTQRDTNLPGKAVGESVNIECDLIGKYIRRLMPGIPQFKNEAGDLTVEFLRDNGFVS